MAIGRRQSTESRALPSAGACDERVDGGCWSSASVASAGGQLEPYQRRLLESPPPPPVERVVPTGWDSYPDAPRQFPFEPSGWDSDPPPPPPQQAEAEKPRMSWAVMAQQDELAAAAADDDMEEGEEEEAEGEADEGAAGAASVPERAAEGRGSRATSSTSFPAWSSTPACSAPPSRSASWTASTTCRRWASAGSLEGGNELESDFRRFWEEFCYSISEKSGGAIHELCDSVCRWQFNFVLARLQS